MDIDELMHEVCKQRWKFRYLFVLGVVVFGLMLLWYPFVELGTSTRVVVVLNLVWSSGVIVVSGVFIWRCRLREEDRGLRS